jgi:pimeloyl-ACP methyl ester carboxylesterase
MIILVHGFFRKSRDMKTLSNMLKDMGYKTHAVNLPTIFKSLEDCYLAFKEQLDALNIDKQDTCHFVGHSMGGLIIRYYLSKHKVPNIGKCVFIGTPNQGSRLADIADNIPLAARILKPIPALRSDAVPIAEPLNIPPPEVGIIAGNNHRMITGPFLNKPNDGRVEVASSKLPAHLMKDFIVLPFIHTKIHQQLICAKLLSEFLETGKFTSVYPAE